MSAYSLPCACRRIASEGIHTHASFIPPSPPFLHSSSVTLTELQSLLEFFSSIAGFQGVIFGFVALLFAFLVARLDEPGERGKPQVAPAPTEPVLSETVVEDYPTKFHGGGADGGAHVAVPTVAAPQPKEDQHAAPLPSSPMPAGDAVTTPESAASGGMADSHKQAAELAADEELEYTLRQLMRRVH